MNGGERHEGSVRVFNYVLNVVVLEDNADAGELDALDDIGAAISALRRDNGVIVEWSVLEAREL